MAHGLFARGAIMRLSETLYLCLISTHSQNPVVIVYSTHVDTVMHSFGSMAHGEWAELGFFVFLSFVVIVWCLQYRRQGAPRKLHPPVLQHKIPGWYALPETQLMVLALPLHLLWEIAQFPLFTVWHEGDWGYILYGLVHCTLGDLLITLSVFWLVALFNRSRYWVTKATLSDIVLFTLIGLGYTIYSEIVNTRIKGTWGYTELMPIVPVVEIGGMPFMQWLLIPPITLLLMRLLIPLKTKTVI